MKIQYKTAKGTQDFGPSRQALRDKLVGVFVKEAKQVGARPLSTPIIEREEVLMEKYGSDSDKEIFRLVNENDEGERTALRYDLTVSFSRYVKVKGLKKIKRYTAGPVFRRDQPNMGDGRYRQFLQADFDWLGEGDVAMMDAETINLLIEVLNQYNLPNYIIKINTRQILYRMLKWVGVPDNDLINVSRVVDKLDKKKWKELVPELIQFGLSEEVISRLGIVIKQLQTDDWNGLPFTESEYLDQVLRYLGVLSRNKMGLLEKLRIDPTLARGLDYYTGIIFEVVFTGKKYRKQGSIAAGGRYDNLCDSPCVGFSLGIDRMLTVLDPLPKSEYSVTAWVIQVNKELSSDTITQLYNYRLKIMSRLREMGISCDTEPRADTGFGPQLKYVLKNEIPYIVFLGLQEMKTNALSIKNMSTREQTNNILLKDVTRLVT